jgi:hypothetical protein
MSPKPGRTRSSRAHPERTNTRPRARPTSNAIGTIGIITRTIEPLTAVVCRHAAGRRGGAPERSRSEGPYPGPGASMRRIRAVEGSTALDQPDYDAHQQRHGGNLNRLAVRGREHDQQLARGSSGWRCHAWMPTKAGASRSAARADRPAIPAGAASRPTATAYGTRAESATDASVWSRLKAADRARIPGLARRPG